MQESHETPFQSLDREDPLEEGMATHSSIFAWRIPSQTGVWWSTVKKSKLAQGLVARSFYGSEKREEVRKREQKTIQSLQMSPRMRSLRQRSVWFHLFTVFYRWVAQLISLRQAIMYAYNNKKSAG